MTLSRDTARCMGYYNTVAFGRQLDPVCIDCQRRLCQSDSERQVWCQGVVKDEKCELKLGEVK